MQTNLKPQSNWKRNKETVINICTEQNEFQQPHEMKESGSIENLDCQFVSESVGRRDSTINMEELRQQQGYFRNETGEQQRKDGKEDTKTESLKNIHKQNRKFSMQRGQRVGGGWRLSRVEQKHNISTLSVEIIKIYDIENSCMHNDLIRIFS